MTKRSELLNNKDNNKANVAMRPFTESLPMALLQAREATMRIFRPLIGAHELTEQQWRVLRALSSAGEPLSIGTVAEQTFLLAPSLSRIAANLEERGLISRTTADTDQRRSNLELTRQGHATVAKIAPQSEKAYAFIEREFGAERLRELLDELNQLADLAAPHDQAGERTAS
jgi:homoprotocatechuate degradation regulator HpaR